MRLAIAGSIIAIRAAALEGGALSFLVKPFDDEALTTQNVRHALSLSYVLCTR